jgi:hypothetical protein
MSEPERTAADIEAELVRVATWKARCPHCGGARLVAMPHVDLERLKTEPNGQYANGVLAMLKSVYPETTNGN